MEIDRQHTQTYLWVEECIYSCKTHDQLKSAGNLVSLYDERLTYLIKKGEAPSSSHTFTMMLNLAWDYQDKFITNGIEMESL